MLTNIPVELQRLDQWVAAGPDKKPLNPRTGQSADPTDPSTWGSFEEARRCGYTHIGFVLSKNDPYCIIDLDDPFVRKDKTPIKEGDPEWELAQHQAERHALIAESFNSYQELSQSGRGLHIIVRGTIPNGVRRDKVEVYSDARYMICTGNVYKAMPIADYQGIVSQMYTQMNAAAPAVALTQVDGHMSDDQIYSMASTAANAEKFARLWRGEWQGVPEWPSQSEADFALLSMLAFYTKDNEQVRRIFRYSGLVREKSARNDKYLNIALGKIRAKELPAIDFSTLTHRTNEIINQHQSEPSEAREDRTNDHASAIQAGGPGEDSRADESIGESNERSGEERQVDRNALTPPPGFIGELAQYIYSSAIRPVPEIGLAAAIALTAGVVGRAFNISGTGLNQYLILLAKTGSGKEGAATGIDAMVQAVKPQVPMVDEFIGPGAFASGQALIRVLDKTPCFVSVLGEFGLTLQQLCDPKASASQVILKKVLLDIYAKSGFTKVLRSSVYSEAEKNTKLVQAPNVTILGEATPESFYDGLDASAIAQGLIPRFSIFEYDGPRPPRNPHAFQPPPKALVDKFAALLFCALNASQKGVNSPVQVDAQALKSFDAFDLLCDDKINSSEGDVALQLWNRAHLKALKLAALVAVGCNPYQPIVDKEGADWAIQVVTRDITKLLSHFMKGNIGQGDTRMEADLRRAVEDYLRMRPAARKRDYKVPEKLLESPVIPYGYLRRRLRPLASFRSDRRGANAALASIIKAMTDAGELQAVPPIQAREQFGVDSPLYVIGSAWAG